MLKARGVKTIVLCGVATHYCVKATAVDGFHLGFDVLLLEDCIGAKSEVNHTQAMTEMGQSFAKICKSFDFIEMIEKQQWKKWRKKNNHFSQKYINIKIYKEEMKVYKYVEVNIYLICI